MGGLLTNLAEGLARAAGSEGTANAIEAQQQRRQAFSDLRRQNEIAQSMATANNIRRQLGYVDNVQKALALVTDPNTHKPVAGQEQEAARLQGILNNINLNELHGNLSATENYIQQLYDPNFNFGQQQRNPMRVLAEKLHLAKPADPSQAKTAGEQIRELRAIQDKYEIGAPGIEAGEKQLETEQATAEAERTKIQNLEQDVAARQALAKKYLPGDEQAQQDIVMAELTGSKAAPKEKWTVLTAADGTSAKMDIHGDLYTMGGRPMTTEEADKFKVAPKGSAGKKTKYQQQRETYAASLGKKPEDLTWAEEVAMSNTLNPVDRRMQMMEKRLSLAEDAENLRRSEQDFQAFMALQKVLGPVQKIQTAGEKADDYVNHPSAEGDVALVFAFLDATKPNSGFRFNETERRWILGTRGVIEGIETRINEGFTGETLSPEQRQTMRNIIKTAGQQANAVDQSILQGAAQFRPSAAAAASGTINQGKGQMSDDDFLKKF